MVKLIVKDKMEKDVLPDALVIKVKCPECGHEDINIVTDLAEEWECEECGFWIGSVVTKADVLAYVYLQK